MLPRGQRAQLSLWFDRMEPAEQCPPEAGPCLSHAVPHVALSVLGAEISWMGLNILSPEGLGRAWREVGSRHLIPRCLTLYRKGFQKICVAHRYDICPNVHFFIHLRFKVRDFSTSLLIAILVAQSPTKEVLDFSFITSLFM